MAWTTPMTAVAFTPLSASDFNLHVRDNLAYLKTQADEGAATLAARIPQAHTVSTSQSTSSATYTNLTTAGPTVTVTTGTTALVHWALRGEVNPNGAPAL